MLIVLQHGGHWDSNCRYIDYTIDGIVLSTYSTFKNLEAEIRKQLGVHTLDKQIEIKYKLNDRSPPLEIYNDMGVQFYIELKNQCKDVEKYPLCIGLLDMVMDQYGSGSPLPLNEHAESSNAGEIYNVNTSPIHSGDTSAIDSVCDPMLMMLGECQDDETEHATIISDPNQKTVVEGQVYQDKATLVNTTKHYALRNKFQYKVSRSSRTSFNLICTAEGCTWKFRASSLNASTIFKIRKFIDEHTCTLKDRIYSQRQATASIIGGIIKDKYTDPKRIHRPKDIIEDVRKEMSVEIPYMKAWRAKEIALEMMRGNPTESYSKLSSYLYMLRERNPGSVVDLCMSYDDRFLFVFVALNSSIKGWEYCRPIVVVDASFLKAAHKGTFLSASTLDAAGCILPLAYAVVDSENNDAWEWFFQHLREAYGERADMCIVSDRHESILKASSIVYPDIPHYACIWHLWNNIKKNFKRSNEKLYEAFFTMAKAYTMREFNAKMKNVVQLDPRVKEYLSRIGYHKWARVYATANRSWTMTSNIAESINGVNKEGRDLPILAFLEYMRDLVETWSNNNRERANGTFTKLGKKYNKMLNDRRTQAVRMKVKPSGDSYTVTDPRDKVQTKYLVDLKMRTCCCGRFQIDEMPCPHAVAVLKSKNIDEEDFCSLYYTRNYLVKTYEVPVYPIPDAVTWDIPEHILAQVVLPPVGDKQPGRRRTTRYKYSWERNTKRSKITCGACGQEGHNRKTCRNPKTY